MMSQKIKNFTNNVLSSISNLFGKLSSSRKTGKGSRYKSIKFKLISAFAVTIIPIFLLGLISYRNSYTALKDAASQSSQQTIEQASNYFDFLFNTVEESTLQLVINKSFQQYIDTSSTDEDLLKKLGISKNLGDHINNLVFTSDIYQDVFLIGKECDSLSTGGFSLYGINMDSLKDSGLHEKLKDCKGNLAWLGHHKELDKLIKKENRNYSFSIARLTKSIASSKEAAILIVDLKMDKILSALNGINLGDRSEIHLISPDYQKDISILQDKKSDKSKNETEKDVAEITDKDFFKKISTSSDRSGSFSVKHNNQKYLLSYNKLDTGFVMVGLIPISVLVATSDKIKIMTIIFVIVAALVASLWGYLIASSMGRTIKRIITAADTAASGDLTVTLSSRRSDELGMLTKSIYSMISSMRVLIQQTMDITYKVTDSASVVSSTSQQVSSVSHEISRAVQEISNGASSQAQDAEDGVNRMSMLASKINQVSENANAIDGISQDTMALTQDGLISIEELSKKSQDTTASAKSFISDIHKFDENSKSIGKIIKVISGIADQTNLLALNAAIEAARAGEMGKGFAVVADEVRKLAEQSMSASREIAAIINDIQEQTAKTVKRAEATEETLKSQNEAVESTVSVFKNISISMNTLTEKVSQIILDIEKMVENKDHTITSIQNISAVSEETAASSEEVTASTEEQVSSIEELSAYAEELADASKRLSESISRFRIS